jgi:dUTP pyrophosphatase
MGRPRKSVFFKKLHSDGLTPERKTAGAAAYDLFTPDCFTLSSHKSINISLKICVHIPLGLTGQIMSRSGLAFNGNIHAFPGVIDPDYRGELIVKLTNNSDVTKHFERGDGIAQIIFLKTSYPLFIETETLSPSDRGNNGFGSTDRVKHLN